MLYNVELERLHALVHKLEGGGRSGFGGGGGSMYWGNGLKSRIFEYVNSAFSV